ncbi:MAG: hypothetical protein LPK47_03295 [Bacteroidota bacterium]|nr:hypothetical protein [Bacteroidota bacterium]
MKVFRFLQNLRIGKIGFVVCFFLFFFVGIHFVFPNVISPNKLSGVEDPIREPELTISKWFNCEFQSSFTDWFNRMLPDRPNLIRLKNQFLFSVFNQSTTYVLVGKNNQLFAYNYFPSFRGFDCLGKEHWDEMAQKVGAIRDTLDTMGIPLLVVIAPNKVRFMPENLPDHLKRIPGKTTNESLMKESFSKLDIPILDLNSIFVSNKESFEYAPFPNTGAHWNIYGSLIGFDSIQSRIQDLLGEKLNRIRWKTGVVLDSVIETDTELSEGLNLFFPPATEKQFFPKTQDFDPSSFKPNVLIIGDSFYWIFNSTKVNYKIFSSKFSFWYYNSTCYDLNHGQIPVSTLDVWDEIRNRDAIILLATESNLSDFPFGFEEILGKIN